MGSRQKTSEAHRPDDKLGNLLCSARTSISSFGGYAYAVRENH